jgi:hypothetical protein
VRLRVALVRKPAAVRSHAPSTTHEGWAELRISTLGLARGDRKWALNAQTLASCVYMSVRATNRVEGNRRASRNGRVSVSVNDSQLSHRCTVGQG